MRFDHPVLLIDASSGILSGESFSSQELNSFESHKFFRREQGENQRKIAIRAPLGFVASSLLACAFTSHSGSGPRVCKLHVIC